MFTVHEPLEMKQPILELTETKPVGTLIIPDAVSTTVTPHNRLTPTMPVPGQATAVEVGVGETSIAVEEVAVCCGEPLSLMVSVTLEFPVYCYVRADFNIVSFDYSS